MNQISGPRCENWLAPPLDCSALARDILLYCSRYTLSSHSEFDFSFVVQSCPALQLWHGCCYLSLQRQNSNMSLKERCTRCMHAEENKIDDISHMQPLIELKKSINHKQNIKIKFRLHHWISDNENFEIISHLTIFWQNFLFVFF
jgi:hypothetical protein